MRLSWRNGILVAALSAAGIAIYLRITYPSRLSLQLLSPSPAPADGFSQSSLSLSPLPQPLSSLRLSLSPPRLASLIAQTPSQNTLHITLRHGVLPGTLTVRAEAPGYEPASLTLTLELATADSFSDGTPDFLRLSSREDRAQFRRWFTALAEALYALEPSRLPPEVNDCAALLRFAYREALRDHGPGWAAGSLFPPLPVTGALRKYAYPYTPLRASLFRVRDGPFAPHQLDDGHFAEFADANTLRLYNTHFLSRRLSAAQPGDLLFFRQLDQNLPYHAMVFLGPSPLTGDPGPFIVYHTGPLGALPGEMRKVTVHELLRHPSPRWRPEPHNPNFLGVHRWNILRDSL